MKAESPESRRPQVDARKESDHLNAELFVGRYGQNVRWSPELHRWFVWNGAWWEKDLLAKVTELALNTIEGLRTSIAEPDDPAEVERRARHYRASARAPRMKALLDVAAADPRVRVTVSAMDTHPMLLACLNGTIDLSSGELRGANPEDLLTRGVELQYSSDVRSTAWDRFIDTIFRSDQELIAFVQRLMGYCCTGSVQEQILPILCGLGANGKSTLVGTIQRVLGDHAITAPVGLLTQQRYAGHEEMFAELRGRRFVVSNEFEASAVLAEQRIKKLTGGDVLTARELYGQRFYFEPTHKILLVTNQMPRIAVSDLAIWRRILKIPFDVSIPERDQDSSLPRRLFEEGGEAILSWIVEGAVAWSKDGLGASKAILESTQQYQDAEDRVGKFLAEVTVMAQSARLKVGVFYKLYCAWCVQNGESPGRVQDFRWSLERQGLTIRSVSNVQFVLGVKPIDNYGNIEPTTEQLEG